MVECSIEKAPAKAGAFLLRGQRCLSLGLYFMNEYNGVLNVLADNFNKGFD